MVFLPGRKDIDTVEALFKTDAGLIDFIAKELKYLIHPKKALGGHDTIKMSDFDDPPPALGEILSSQRRLLKPASRLMMLILSSNRQDLSSSAPLRSTEPESENQPLR